MHILPLRIAEKSPSNKVIKQITVNLSKNLKISINLLIKLLKENKNFLLMTGDINTH